MQVLAVSTYAAEGDLYDKIHDLDSTTKAAIIGVFWQYVSTYTGGSSSNTDKLVNDIRDKLIAVGLHSVLIGKGITEQVIRDTITSFKGHESAIESIVNLSSIVDQAALQSVLNQLQAGGYISGNLNTLAGNNLAQMLVAVQAINKPIFTNDQSGNVVVKTANLDLLTTLANILIDTNHTNSYADLAVRAAQEINSLSASQKDAIVDVLTDFNLYAVASGSTPTPTPNGGSGGSSGGGGGAANTPAPNTPVPTPTSVTTPVPPRVIDDATVAKEMEKVSVEKVTSTVSGTTAKAVINETSAQELLTKIDAIVSTANTLKAEIDRTDADVKVEKVLNIKVETTSVVSNVDVELPSSIFATAKAKDIDKLSIETSIATIAIPPDALSVTGSEKVSLSASIVDKGMLPKDVQAAVGNETVYDFNAIVGTSKVSEFKKKLEISVPYTLKPGENPKKVTVYYINDKGQLENIVGKYDENTGKISFTTKHFSGYVAKVNNVTFDDVTAGNWAKENIEVMAAKGVIAGVGDGQFLPDDSVTRAEFAAMIVRTFKLQDATATSTFSDINESDWFYGEVSAAVKAGIITGRPDGTFAPNENITRQDMAVIVARVLKSIKNKTLSTNAKTLIDKFGDKAEVASYAKDSVSMAVKYGVINGMAGNFVPNQNTTRAQTAAVIYRVFYLE